MRSISIVKPSLQAQHPGKFVPPPLSFARLNWRHMLVCGVIQAVLVGIVLGLHWVVYSDLAWIASALAGLAEGLLFGMGLMAGGRVQGWWKRLLLLVPALVLVFVIEVIWSSLPDAPARSGSPYAFGFVYDIFMGAILMASGFTSRSRQNLPHPRSPA